MKTKLPLTILFACLILVKTKAQTNCNPLFQKILYNRDTLLQPLCMVVNDDESFVIAGSSRRRLGTSNDNAYFSKFDKNGAVLWSRNYAVVNNPNTFINTIRGTSDGGYIGAGRIERGAILLKLDSSGSVQWSKTFLDTTYNPLFTSIYFQDVRPMGKDGYIIIGVLSLIDIGQIPQIVLIKTNTTGDVQWANTYPLNRNFSDVRARGVVVDGPNIIVTMQNQNIYAMQVNKNTGQQVWMKTYSFADSVYTDIQQIYKSGDNYIVSGARGVYGQAVFYINKRGLPVNALNITLNLPSVNAFVSDNGVLPTHDGGFITNLVLERRASEERNTYINKFTASGKLQWNKEFDNRNSKIVKEMPDSGFIFLFPRIVINGVTQFHLARTDKYGNTGGCINSGVSVKTGKLKFSATDFVSNYMPYTMSVSSTNISASNVIIANQETLCYTGCPASLLAAISNDNASVRNETKLKVFPNPAVNNASLYFGSTKPGTYSVNIFDFSGKIIKQLNGTSVSGNNVVTVNLSGFQKGAYTLQLINGSQKPLITKLIKQ